MFARICLLTCVCSCMFNHIHLFAYVYSRFYSLTYARVCLLTYVCSRTFIHVFTHIRLLAYVYSHMFVHICLFVYVCVPCASRFRECVLRLLITYVHNAAVHSLCARVYQVACVYPSQCVWSKAAFVHVLHVVHLSAC